MKKPYTWDKVPQTFDAEYAAMLCAVSRRTILYWCRMGIIPATKPGKAWLFDKDAIREWIAGKGKNAK